MQTLFMAGDSTAAQKLIEKRPESGWGEFLPLYLKDDVELQNKAINGRSTKSFIEEGHFENIMNQAKENDILIVQFAHNDEKIEDSARYTDPNTSYKENLRFMIEKAQEKKMNVILMSSICRANFNDKQEIASTLGIYRDAMREVANSYTLPFIDMQAITQAYFNTLGVEKTNALFLQFDENLTKNYPEGVDDHTHLNFTGAWAICDLSVNELRKHINIFNQE